MNIDKLKAKGLTVIDRRGKANGGNPKGRKLSNLKRGAQHWDGVARKGEVSAIESHENYWRGTLGWNLGGYHIFIPRSGSIIINYDFETQTNGVGNQNADTVHVCYSGSPAEPMTDEQKAALKLVWDWIREEAPTIKTILGHNEFVNHESNQCPGINMSDFRRMVDNVQDAVIRPAPAPAQPQIEDIAVPSPTGKKLHLPASAKTWRVYDVNGPYTTAHAIHQLTPAAFNGLTYDILGNPAEHVYLIRTGVKGTVAIYAGPGTGARITGGASVPVVVAKKNKLHLPASAQTWRVYNVNGPYTVGNEIHLLTPSAFGGITYDILENKGNGVYVINTSVRGRVAIYADPARTSAKIS